MTKNSLSKGGLAVFDCTLLCFATFSHTWLDFVILYFAMFDCIVVTGEWLKSERGGRFGLFNAIQGE